MNDDDLSIIPEAWGRKIDTLPALPPQTEPWPPVPTPTANRCGDLNGDGVVDAYDLALFDDRIALCGSELYSGMFDVNHDFAISEADRMIIRANSHDEKGPFGTFCFFGSLTRLLGLRR